MFGMSVGDPASLLSSIELSLYSGHAVSQTQQLSIFGRQRRSQPRELYTQIRFNTPLDHEPTLIIGHANLHGRIFLSAELTSFLDDRAALGNVQMEHCRIDHARSWA